MIKRKNIIFTIVFAFILLPMFSQIKITEEYKILTPVKSKIKVTGFAAYYGNAKYISVHIKLMYKGKPLSTPTVMLNGSVINNNGNGEYYGALTPYNNMRTGNRLVFTAEFPKNRIRLLKETPFPDKLILATYRISNIIEWVYPRPQQIINIKNILTIPFRWNFTGTPAITEFFIKDNATNKKIFSKNINNESQNVNASLLKPGQEYIMGMWAVDPLGKFQISRSCDSGSEVKFYFSNTMRFRTKSDLEILSPPKKRL